MSMVRQKNVDILFKYLLWQLPDFQKVQFKYMLTTIWGSYSWHKLKSLFSNLESSFTSAKNIRSSTSLKQGKTIPAYLEQACRTLQSTWRARIELATCTIWTCVALTFPTASVQLPMHIPAPLHAPRKWSLGSVVLSKDMEIQDICSDAEAPRLNRAKGGASHPLDFFL